MIKKYDKEKGDGRLSKKEFCELLKAKKMDQAKLTAFKAEVNRIIKRQDRETIAALRKEKHELGQAAKDKAEAESRTKKQADAAAKASAAAVELEKAKEEAVKARQKAEEALAARDAKIAELQDAGEESYDDNEEIQELIDLCEESEEAV